MLGTTRVGWLLPSVPCLGNESFGLGQLSSFFLPTIRFSSSDVTIQTPGCSVPNMVQLRTVWPLPNTGSMSQGNSQKNPRYISACLANVTPFGKSQPAAGGIDVGTHGAA